MTEDNKAANKALTQEETKDSLYKKSDEEERRQEQERHQQQGRQRESEKFEQLMEERRREHGRHQTKHRQEERHNDQEKQLLQQHSMHEDAQGNGGSYKCTKIPVLT